MKAAGLVTLFILILFSIDTSAAQEIEKSQNISIEILPAFKGIKLLKKQWHLTPSGDSIQVSKLRFYLTDFELLNASNERTSIPESNHLIDAFDSKTLRFDLKTNKTPAFTQISCKIGVDEKLHDAGAQSGDLDPIHGMYWAWQSGFINFKLEGKSPSCNTRKNKFSFHIGGYKTPYATTIKQTLDLKKPITTHIIIEVDISIFFNDIHLEKMNQIMIPGEKAYELSQKLPQLFFIKDE